MKVKDVFDRISIVLDILVAVLVPVIWLSTLFRVGEGGTLEPVGLTGLKYFTILSNLLAGLAAQIFLYTLHSPDTSRFRSVLTLKLVAAVSVSITFLTVVLFLGPLYGYRSMYTGSNLFFHLLIPIFSILSISIGTHKTEFPKQCAYPAMLPVLIYGIVYLFNNLINGIGTWPDTNDWYGFLLWGYPVGLIIFGMLMLISYAVARVLIAIHNKI